MLTSRQGFVFVVDRSLLQEAARRRSAQSRLDRAAADRAAMLVQVAAVARARMQEQLEATRSQANQKWAQRVQVGKIARSARLFPHRLALPHQACLFSGVGVGVGHVVEQVECV